MHPLAGQGLNLGIGDAVELSRVIAEGAAIGRDAGSILGLAQYERKRQGVNVMMGGTMDLIKRVFAYDERHPSFVAEPWAMLRGAGMRALDASPAIKAGMMRMVV